MFGRIERYLIDREVKRILNAINTHIQTTVDGFGSDDVDVKFSVIISLRRSLSPVPIDDFKRHMSLLLRNTSGFNVETGIYNVSSLDGFFGIQARMHATRTEDVFVETLTTLTLRG